MTIVDHGDKLSIELVTNLIQLGPERWLPCRGNRPAGGEIRFIPTVVRGRAVDSATLTAAHLESQLDFRASKPIYTCPEFRLLLAKALSEETTTLREADGAIAGQMVTLVNVAHKRR